MTPGEKDRESLTVGQVVMMWFKMTTFYASQANIYLVDTEVDRLLMCTCIILFAIL